MEILNLEVICRLRAFKQFMLYLLYDNILAIKHNENIARSEVDSGSLTLDRRVERMFGRADDFLAVYRNVNPLIGLVAE